MSRSGEIHLLPNLWSTDGDAEDRGELLSQTLDEGDWALWPPVSWDPAGVRTHGKLEVLRPPSSEHRLGTDDRGRDVLSRLIHGTRLSLWLALLCAVLATLIGCLLAVLAHASRGLDAVVITSCDTVAAVPILLVVIMMRGLIGADSLVAMVLLIAVPRGAGVARLVRDRLHTVLREPYCQAARSIGCSRGRVLWRHALPQCFGQICVAAGVTASTAVLAEVALSFLGLGVAAPSASWGELLRQAHDNSMQWWLSVPAGAASALLVLLLGRVSAERG